MIRIRLSKTPTLLSLVLGVALASFALPARGHGDEDHSSDATSQPADTQAVEFTGDPYPLAYCVVTGDALDAMGGAIDHVHEGRHIQFCCDSCKEEFIANPEKWIETIDRKILEQQIARYPLQNCMVSGEKLGSMGSPVDIVVANRLVRLCCPNCEKTVRANPGKYIEQLDAAAIEAQRADYPSDTCIVSGEKLGSQGKIKEIVYAGRLVRLCCPSCAKQFNANPRGYLKKLDGAPSEPSSRPAASAEESSSHDHSGHEH